MGDFTLGCLLGQYDKAQSFDQSSVNLTTGSKINSWDLFDFDVNSFWSQNSAGGFSTSTVHSSQQGLTIRTYGNSTVRTVMRYYYGYNNDAYGRWFPDVTTHDLRLDFWAGEAWAAGSGDLSIVLVGDPSASPNLITKTIGAENKTHQRGTTTVRSDATPWPRIDVEVAAVASSAQMVLDDVLLQVDPITLHPEWSYQEVSRQYRPLHRTQGGVLNSYKWSQHKAYSVPLTLLSTSHADLINWWWENNFRLAFTVNTSDSESTHICQITNETQPIGSRARPYADMWNGMIQLETIDKGSLVF